MTRTLVAVNRQGRITLPAAIRRRLGISEGTQLEVRADDAELTLRPTTTILADDRWAYTPEALASLKRALADIKAGRVYRLSPEDLMTGNYPKRRKKR